MRAVFFVRVVGLVRPLEHGFAGTYTRAVSRVLLAGFATLGIGFESVSVALLDKRRRYDEKVKTNKNKQIMRNCMKFDKDDYKQRILEE